MAIKPTIGYGQCLNNPFIKDIHPSFRSTDFIHPQIVEFNAAIHPNQLLRRVVHSDVHVLEINDNVYLIRFTNLLDGNLTVNYLKDGYFIPLKENNLSLEVTTKLAELINQFIKGGTNA